MFSLNSKLKRFVVTIMIVLTLLLSSGIPQQTSATWPSIDYVLNAISSYGWIGQAYKWIEANWQLVLEQIVARTGRAILHQMTLETVKWIDSGFQGNPAFITDPAKSLETAADRTIGDFLLEDPALNFLCDPFKIQIKLALGLQYRPFEDTIKCSLSGALKNVDNAMNDFLAGDFINGGGWDSWLQISTQPQNNQMGAMILAQGELDARLSGNKEIQLKEADWGGGFLSMNVCETVNAETGLPVAGAKPEIGSNLARDTSSKGTTLGGGAAGGGAAPVRSIHTAGAGGATSQATKQKCKITTPGAVLAGKIGWSDSSDIRQIELAKDLDAIASALLNYAAKSVTDLAVGLLGRSQEKGDTGYKKILADYQKSVKMSTANANKSVKNSQAEMKAAIAQAQKRMITEGKTGKISASPISMPGTASLGTIGTGLGSGGGVGTDTGPSGVINGWIALEQNFLATQVSIFNFLDIIEKAFASSTCTTAMISDVVNQIQGTSTDKTIAGTLQWNKVDIGFASSSSNFLINAWTDGLTALQSVPADNTVAISAITRTLTSLTSPPQPPRLTIADVQTFNIGANGVGDGALFTAIKNWVTGKLNATTGVCSFDTSFNRSSLAPWGIQ